MWMQLEACVYYLCSIMAYCGLTMILYNVI